MGLRQSNATHADMWANAMRKLAIVERELLDEKELNGTNADNWAHAELKLAACRAALAIQPQRYDDVL